MTLKQAKDKAVANHDLAVKSGFQLAAEYWAGVYLGLALSIEGFLQAASDHPEYAKGLKIGNQLKAVIA